MAVSVILSKQVCKGAKFINNYAAKNSYDLTCNVVFVCLKIEGIVDDLRHIEHLSANNEDLCDFII